MKRLSASILAAAVAASAARGQTPCSSETASEGGRFGLGEVSLLDEGSGVGSPRPRLFDRRTVQVSSGLLLAVPVAGYFLWWRSHKATPFHIGHEGYFGRNTYAGGADKASHFVFNGIAQHGMQRLYEDLGHPPSNARWLGFGATVLGGLIVETGDGFKYGGFSWEDISANVLGALSSAEIDRRGWQDFLGFRYGPVPSGVRPASGQKGNVAEHYSQEIYTADLQLAGVLRRRHRDPGLARFLLLSATYGTKGYHYVPAEERERNLGVEIGLNVPETMRALGVPEDPWWAKILYTTFRYVRVPYTAWGYRYDLNHRRWHGPDTGQ